MDGYHDLRLDTLQVYSVLHIAYYYMYEFIWALHNNNFLYHYISIFDNIMTLELNICTMLS